MSKYTAQPKLYAPLRNFKQFNLIQMETETFWLTRFSFRRPKWILTCMQQCCRRIFWSSESFGAQSSSSISGISKVVPPPSIRKGIIKKERSQEERRKEGRKEATEKNHHRHRQPVIDTYSDIRSLRQHPR